MPHTLPYQALLGLHFVGLAFGLGGATISDYSFFKGLRMSDRITPEAVNWMRSFSQVVWVGIGLLALSGIGLVLLNPHEYLRSSGFIAKMIFVVILVINGLFLNFYTTARLTTFNFSENYQGRGAAWWARKLSFVFGAISTVTWYAVLLTAMFKATLHLSLIGYLAIYVTVLCVAVVGSLALEKLLHRHFGPRVIPAAPVAQPAPAAAVPPANPTVAQGSIASVVPQVVPTVIPARQSVEAPEISSPNTPAPPTA